MKPDTHRQTDERTDEQFCAMLSDASAELDNTEIRSMKDALATYRAETLEWAKRRSAAQPSLAAAAGTQSRWAAAPQWALAAIAVVTVTVGVLHGIGTHTTATTSMTQMAQERSTSQRTHQQQLVDDNTLLESIDSALNAGTHLPVDAFGLEEGRNISHHGSVE